MSRKPAVLAFAFLLAAVCVASPPRKAPAGWRTYHSADYGFAIDYPGSVTFYPGHPDLLEAQLSYIPICDETTVACFEYHGKEYVGTTFEAAGISVNVLREIKTEAECNRIDTGSFPVKVKVINGISFHYAETGEAALSKSKGGLTYRAFHGNVCFEVASAVAAVSMGPFEPGEIKPFDSTKLDGILDRMVRTFRFQGPVKDGPGWKVYNDGGCGAIYEYPEEETVHVTVEYANERFYSNEVTCAQAFTHNGMEYTVAAQANLRDQNQMDSWLKASRYAALDRARVVAKSEDFTVYDAGTCYYIYGQARLFVLSVDDPGHNVINPHDDRVFMHLVNSFKVR